MVYFIHMALIDLWRSIPIKILLPEAPVGTLVSFPHHEHVYTPPNFFAKQKISRVQNFASPAAFPPKTSLKSPNDHFPKLS